MAAEDANLILARLEGFLKAFEWFNHKTNHGCTFAVIQMAKAAEVPAALASYFGLQPSDFRVERLADFERELREVFARFLFLFREPAGGHQYGDYLVDPRNRPSIRLLERFGFRLEGLLRARWRVSGEICDSAIYGLLAPEFVRELQPQGGKVAMP